MTAWRMNVIFEIDAEDLDAAAEIGQELYTKLAGPAAEVAGVRWMLPIGEFKEREPFAPPPPEDVALVQRVSRS